jgi:hypothetical protein
MIALVVGMIGLLWYHRWARILFSAAAVLVPLMAAAAGLEALETLVSNAVWYSADAASNLLLGVLLAMIWLWLPEEFWTA